MFYFQDSVRRLLPSWLSPDQRSRGITADYLFSAATANWERKRPVMVMIMLDSLTRSDVASRGVPVLDLHLAEIAKRTGKKLVSRTFCRVVIVVSVVVAAAAAAILGVIIEVCAAEKGFFSHGTNLAGKTCLKVH